MNASPFKRIDLIALGLTAAACLLAALLRVFPIGWNFAPVGALALFAGARLRGPLAYVVPLLLVLCTDAVLAWTRGYDVIHAGTPWVFASFLIAVVMGRGLARTENPFAIGGMALAGSVQFFLITNFGAWVDLALVNPHPDFGYPATLAGVMESYVKGVPFYRGTLVGDMLFTALFFGAYALLIRTFPAYRLQPVAPISVQDDSDEVRRDH